MPDEHGVGTARVPGGIRTPCRTPPLPDALAGTMTERSVYSTFGYRFLKIPWNTRWGGATRDAPAGRAEGVVGGEDSRVRVPVRAARRWPVGGSPAACRDPSRAVYRRATPSSRACAATAAVTAGATRSSNGLGMT
ncbi:hypothetical protein GCM10010140_34710 [Streptosporangium pseudovulgare]|uniref:Uncharacterized protein n=1 Tax=Streptosporangium pseudovulgare TaxID=35765 RepID=A0ABQ2QXB6_9ACTN|nr:hypothetical protein GCM10010140_34710 [Streptosporangium pseudovulgare]